MTNYEYRSIPLQWIRKRELGLNKKLSLLENRKFNRKLYSCIQSVHKWDPKETVDSTHHGGIFNLDFSPDGSLLAAACEGHSILLFDPFNGKLTGEKSKAHTDCVNCVKFLDSRLFATCSDDTTVALWDVRYLRNKLRDLRGHTNWVKNIEYDRNNGLLVTSGFDGNIFTWDINRYSDTETKGNKVFTYKLLMRSKLSPDSSKLVISTQNGYIIVIHDLDLLNLGEDLKGIPHYGYPSSWQFLSKKNKSKRNRIELIKEWPLGDNASDIASLQIHPQGWCTISRNVSRDKKSEWTCIHDLQETLTVKESSSETDFSVMPHTSCCQSASTYTPASASTAPTTLVTSSPRTSTVGGSSLRTRLASSIIINPTTSETAPMGTVSAPSIVINPPSFSMQSPVERSDGTFPGNLIDNQQPPSVVINSGAPSSYEQDRAYSSSITIHITNSENSRSISTPSRRRVQILDFQTRPSDSSTQGQSTSLRAETLDAAQSGARVESRWSINPSNDDLESLLHDDLSSDTSDDDSDVDLLSPNVRQHFESDNEDFMVMRDDRARQYQDLVDLIVRYRYNVSRGIIDVNHRVRVGPTNDNLVKSQGKLLYFTEEPNVARGFIKELCFSADGRLVCSPFAFGVRLLSFDPDCNELCDIVPTIPMRLYELGTCLSHNNVVVTCKFSPQHCMFVSGCLSGKVVFHQPIL